VDGQRDRKTLQSACTGRKTAKKGNLRERAPPEPQMPALGRIQYLLLAFKNDPAPRLVIRGA